MRRVRVCFALPSLHGGGAERAAALVLNNLDGDRFDRRLFLSRREGVYFDDLDPAIQVTCGSGGSLASRVRQFAGFLRSVRPHAVVLSLSPLAGILACAISRVRPASILSVQNPIEPFLRDPDYFGRKPVRRALRRASAAVALRAVDRIVVSAAGLAGGIRAMPGIDAARIFVIPNPVDVQAIASFSQRSEAVPRDVPIVVSAGRLVYQKDFPTLIEAIRLAVRGTPLRCYILGTGRRRPELEGQIERSGLAGIVNLCGFQSDPWRFMRCADVFALPSRYEGFGNVLIEAMACGAPVVATDTDGARDIVQRGENGLLVPVGDANAMAGAIVALVRDRSLWSRLAANARRRAMDYDAAAVAARYGSVICGAVGAAQ
jgi:glycosyltransferase involved in cell wall biosynthesis